MTNQSGGVLSRHDYEPFGEELPATLGLRATTAGYSVADGVRQQYAGMEGDDSRLSHTLWRQYDSRSGRWTAPDPYNGSMELASPQSLNRYSYVNNDPVNKVDPTGLMLSDIGAPMPGDGPSNFIFLGWLRDLTFGDTNGTYASQQGRRHPPRLRRYRRRPGISRSNRNPDGVGKSEGAAQQIGAVQQIRKFSTPWELPNAIQQRLPIPDIPIFGGFNPNFHPLPWRLPNTIKPWTPTPPTFTPTDPPPPPPGWREGYGRDTNGVWKRLFEYDPNSSNTNRFSRAGIGVIRAILNATPDVGVPSVPFIVIPNLPREIWCRLCDKTIPGSETTQ